MPDDFRKWGLLDVERASELIAKIVAWVRDLRHSRTESIDNEEARTHELAAAIRKFNNDRLAPTTGTYWVAHQTPLKLLDRLTVVDGAFIDRVLAKAIPAYDNGVRRLYLDGKYWLPSQRDARRIIEWSQVNTIPWQSDIYDCDDHAEALRHDFRSCRVNACGLIVDWSGGHAYNIVIFPDEQFWFVEAQSDRIVAIGDGIYKLSKADVLL